VPGWFTKTQLLMLAVLSDGQPHRREELHAILPDDLGPMKNIRPHISKIRKLIRPQGLDVACVWYKRNFCYQQVRLLNAGPCRCRA
jgi:hypothetical protein